MARDPSDRPKMPRQKPRGLRGIIKAKLPPKRRRPKLIDPTGPAPRRALKRKRRKK